MEGTLLVTPEQLKNTASEFANKASQVSALHTQMISKVNALNGTWTGEAAQAYQQKFNALQKSMDTINRMITEHVTDLNEMADKYAQAETAAAKAAADLPASTLD